MPKIDRKMRPRRIAADEAHAWARSLRLGNHHGKSVLKALSLYVDGDGWCFVGIEQLADDCELSPDTVRRRLAWLEEIGAVLRRSQWIDSKGCRNGDMQGKRTSDLIRMMVDAGTDHLIEARARGEIVDDDEGDDEQFSPSSQQGLNSEADPVGPAPALCQPSHCGEGLISEPEPESTPKPPSRGRENADQVEGENEPEHFAPAWQAWRGHEVMRHKRHLALAEFKLLSSEKQRLCRAAIGPYNALQDKFRRTTVVNFHLWIRQKGFEEFPDAKLITAPPVPERRWLCGDELVGMEVVGVMADRRIRSSIDPERGAGFWTQMAPRADLVALAAFHGQQPSEWIEVDQGSAQFAAWRDRLQQLLGGDEIRGQRVWTEPHDPLRHDIPAIHPNFAFRKWKQVLRVPAPWPPRRDGTWAADEGETT